MIEMKVYGLALDEESQAPVLILKDSQENTVLPIWIGSMEAMAISLTLNGVSLPRPMTHDLILSTIGAMGGKVVSVNLMELREGTFFAEIEIEQNGETIRVDSRPSDAIALALRAQAGIFAHPDLLLEAGQPKEIITGKAKALLETEDGDKWLELLEKFSLDDLKYKM